jgi:hypothetical protein
MPNIPIIGINAGTVNLTGSLLANSGSVGRNFASMSLENTASLGLSASISVYSASLAEVINDTTASYDFTRHTENTIKFLTAKVYENTDKISKVYTDNQIFYGHYAFRNRVRGPEFQGSFLGNATSATTATTATTATNINALANNSNNESNYITFVDGASSTQRIETDTGLRYNPAENLISSTITSAHTASFSKGYKGLSDQYWLTPTDFKMTRSTAIYTSTGAGISVAAGRMALSTFTLPSPSQIYKKVFRINCTANGATCQLNMHSLYGPYQTVATLASGNVNTDLSILNQSAKLWNPTTMYLAATITAADDRASILTSGVVYFTQK